MTSFIFNYRITLTVFLFSSQLLTQAQSAVEFEVPTDAAEYAVLTAMQSESPEKIAVAMALPEDFDPSHTYPILITQVTGDKYRPNIEEMEVYRAIALEQGYVVLTAQAISWPSPKNDSINHRYVSIRAALRWLENEYPGSRDWPIAIAGFSGGAKMSQILAASLLVEERNLFGIFLGGCNEDYTKNMMKQYRDIKKAYRNTAIFLSSGKSDKIAKPSAMKKVFRAMKKNGIKQVRIEVYADGHQYSPEHIEEALKWFLKVHPIASHN